MTDQPSLHFSLIQRIHFNVAGALLACAFVLSPLGSNLAQASSDDPPICYSTTPVHDPVAHLKARLDRGETTLKYDQHLGWLASLLKALDVPPSSQTLVFSKTSFQRNLISHRKPRALYFNDDTYVGSVRNGTVIEIATMDPRQGAIFYTLKQEPTSKPVITRQTSDCLECHESGMSRNVPGLLMRSVYPDDEGLPALSAGSYVTTDESPWRERWGGWYVTGTHGRMRHMGNVTIDDDDHPDVLEVDDGANVINLTHRLKTSAYLEPTSDIVALMVLGHQTSLHNLMTRTGYEVRTALRDQQAINEALHEKPSYRSDSTKHRILSACEPLVEAMLFSHAAALIDPVCGTSSFAKDFAARGPHDHLGRSLRDFDLKHRMFKYPCSYLIYSEQFDALPAEAKQYVYQRLWDVLSGKDDSAAFAELSTEDRHAILQILLDTKKGLPAYWEAAGK